MITMTIKKKVKKVILMLQKFKEDVETKKEKE